ncbi:MAG: DivIVA domain-containing protein [Lachnospiraceae bacterium]|nr:DivIVA domain-containing protein [Lachnospiraceae bacterium]MBQ7864019.1 DivIVA domain-containing protein [Lachnospiraceae bacterium]
MLTPVEIQNRVFKSGGLGYDKKDVDAFMKEIVDSYELIYREKMELADKVNVLNDALQNYKTIEKTMQKALMLAQKTAEETQETALRNAHAIEKEAMTKSEIIVSDAQRELERIHQKTVQLCQQYEKYKLQFKNLAAAQIELLETESFQIHMMDLPTVELDSLKQAETPEDEPELTEEDLPKIDISFTNVASDAE